MYDLLLKGGTVIDPSVGLNGVQDIAVRDGVIAHIAPDIDAAEGQVGAAAQAHGKHWGRPAGSADQLEALFAKGARFVANGSDFSAMMWMMNEASGQLDQAIARARS